MGKNWEHIPQAIQSNKPLEVKGRQKYENNKNKRSPRAEMNTSESLKLVYIKTIESINKHHKGSRAFIPIGM